MHNHKKTRHIRNQVRPSGAKTKKDKNALQNSKLILYLNPLRNTQYIKHLRKFLNLDLFATESNMYALLCRRNLTATNKNKTFIGINYRVSVNTLATVISKYCSSDDLLETEILEAYIAARRLRKTSYIIKIFVLSIMQGPTIPKSSKLRPLICINLFSTNISLLYPSESIRKPQVFWYFQGG